MGIDRKLLEDLTNHVLRRISNRIANTVARGVVKLVDDSKKLQLLQLGVLAGETVDGAEHFQPYGFSSIPKGDAEAVVIFPNGDRSHPIVIGAPDRRYRPTGGQSGQVDLYHYSGSKVTMLASGDIVMKPGPGGKVLVDDGAGGTEPLVLRSEFLGHGHATAGTGAPSCPIVVATPASSATFPGTAALESK